ncbi:Hypothetical_protein [Hexamita inflata]|uniref:Hypothetical_protein n=1 Tax=Hexamita inflata TaxID=28002 RepID=A0AA86QB07_9EUKA|nr:Hypothetical protein HINF_LOCUS37252 [Hexamita inflata]
MGYQTADVSVGQISRDTMGNQSITCNQTTYINPFQPNGNGNDSYVQNGTADADISDISYFDGQTHLSQREKYAENEIIQLAMSIGPEAVLNLVKEQQKEQESQSRSFTCLKAEPELLAANKAKNARILKEIEAKDREVTLKIEQAQKMEQLNQEKDQQLNESWEEITRKNAELEQQRQQLELALLQIAQREQESLKEKEDLSNFQKQILLKQEIQLQEIENEKIQLMAREIIISQNSGKPPHKPENIQKVSVSVETPHNKEAQTVMETEKEAANPLSENMPSIQLVSHNEISKYQTPKAHEELNITYLCAKKCQKESEKDAIPELLAVPKPADGKDEFQQPNKLEPPPFELPKAENQELRDFPKEEMHVLIDTICGHGCKTTTRKFEEIPTNPLNNVDLVQTQRECILVSKQEIATEMEKIQRAYKSRNLHIKCPVPNCKYSFNQVYDLMCHFQDNYKSHDIKLISNIREMIVKELDSHNLKNQKFNHYLLCINCQCPFRDLKAAITHQQKCIFYHEIVRATDQQNTPQDSEGGEANNQSGEKRRPGRPKPPRKETITPKILIRTTRLTTRVATTTAIMTIQLSSTVQPPKAPNAAYMSCQSTATLKTNQLQESALKKQSSNSYMPHKMHRHQWTNSQGVSHGLKAIQMASKRQSIRLSLEQKTILCSASTTTDLVQRNHTQKDITQAKNRLSQHLSKHKNQTSNTSPKQNPLQLFTFQQGVKILWYSHKLRYLKSRKSRHKFSKCMNIHQLENQVSETCISNTHIKLAIDYSSKCSNKASIRYMKQQLSRTNLNYTNLELYTQINTNLIVMENRIIDQYKSKKHCSPATIPCSKDVQSAKLKSIKTNLQSHHPECYQPNTNSLWQSKAALSPSNST